MFLFQLYFLCRKQHTIFAIEAFIRNEPSKFYFQLYSMYFTHCALIENGNRSNFCIIYEVREKLGSYYAIWHGKL